jgi:membrane associated rhomboid family serine protease
MFKDPAYLARVFLIEKVKKVFATTFLRCFRGGMLMLFSCKLIFRTLLFPFILGIAYLLQVKFPWLFKQGALWSDHPQWWQFFTNGFLSGNWIHLLFNACGLWFVCSQFAPRVRLCFLFVYFLLFSAVSSFLYFKWAMPSHATLVGASSGVYSLLGFLSWFLRRDRVGFFGIQQLSAPVLPFMAFMLILEFFAAKYWLPVLAWQLHLIAFGLSLCTAIVLHMAYATLHWLAGQEHLMFKTLLVQGMEVLQRIKRTVKVPVMVSGAGLNNA